MDLLWRFIDQPNEANTKCAQTVHPQCVPAPRVNQSSFAKHNLRFVDTFCFPVLPLVSVWSQLTYLHARLRRLEMFASRNSWLLSSVFKRVKQIIWLKCNCRRICKHISSFVHRPLYPNQGNHVSTTLVVFQTKIGFRLKRFLFQWRLEDLF